MLSFSRSLAALSRRGLKPWFLPYILKYVKTHIKRRAAAKKWAFGVGGVEVAAELGLSTL